MAWLQRSCRSKVRLPFLQLALVMMIILMCPSSGRSFKCYRCDSSSNSRYNDNSGDCKVAPGDDTGCGDHDEKDNFCYIYATTNGEVKRNCGSSGTNIDEMVNHGKVYTCRVDKCNGFKVTKESDLDKYIKEAQKQNSAVGQLHYSNIGLLVSLCGFTLWFVITNVSSIIFDGGPGPL